MQQHWQDFSGYHFDLTRTGPFKLKLLVCDENRHVLLMNFHHIISDAWSMNLMTQELSQLYARQLGGTQASGNPEMAPVKLQFGDFAYWQQQAENIAKQQKQLAYWQEQLKDSPNILPLNYDFPKLLQPGFSGKTRAFDLSKGLVSALHTYCKAHKKTPFMVLLAGLNALLRRNTGEQDIVIGTSIANRKQAELGSVLGFFANTLALRVQQNDKSCFEDLVEQCCRVTLDGNSHQEIGFEKVVEAVKPERSLSHTPLFQVMLVLDNTPSKTSKLQGLTLKPLELELDIAKFDLTFYAELQEDAGTIRIQYNDSLFKAGSIAALFEQLTILLGAGLQNPHTRVSCLPLMAQKEQQVLSVPSSWPGEDINAPLLHQLFEQQAMNVGGNIAVNFEQQSLTYAQLNREANRLAHWMITQGIEPQSRVGLCFDRGLTMIVCLLATLKVGATYVPLDPSAPKKRLSFIVEDADLMLVLSQHSAWTVNEHEKMAVTFIEDIKAQLESFSELNPDLVLTADQTAYMIYTSGSTGQPKGVMVSHNNASGLFDAAQKWFDFNADDVWTMFHSFAFDFSVWEIWGPLLSGGKVVVVPYLESRSPEIFYQLLKTQKVTVLNQTPTAFNLLSCYEQGLDRPHRLDLRYVIFGGETLDFHSLKPWFALHGDEQPQLFNMFGITETTVHVTCRRVRMDDCDGDSSFIGEALPDMQCYVLDEALNIAPAGVPGELHVSGRGVSQGYWLREELTQERFIDSPFGHEKMYRTGDLARRTAEGELEYLGRIDHQVQLRGFRIELDEIDSVLSAHEHIHTAKSIIVDNRGEPAIAAYLVAKDELGIAGLRDYLSGYLPVYMLPGSYNRIETLPLTLNGKLDINALPAPVWGTGADMLYQAPAGKVEQQLANIWQTVLQVEQVGRGDNFFQRGGDSIKCISVVNMARKFGLALTIEILFQSQSLADMAAQIEPGVEQLSAEQQLAEQHRVTTCLPFSLISNEAKAALPEGIEDAYPLSSLQKGMLFHGETDSEQPLYHNSASTLIKGELDVARFKVALSDLLSRHEILRSSFDALDGDQYLQLVHKQVPTPFAVEDLTALTPAAKSARIALVEAQEKTTPFILAQAPLLRIRILLLGADQFQFVWTEHHAIMDGWSVSQFFEELMALYMAEVEQEIQPAPELKYRDFIAAEQAALNNEKHQLYWQESLVGFTTSELPVWPGIADSETFELNQALPAILIDQLNQKASEFKLPLKTLLLTVHLAVMARLTGNSKVLVGYSVHGRPVHEGAERMIGLFVSMLPLAVDTAHQYWGSLCRGVYQQEVDIIKHRAYPLNAIQALLKQRQLIESCFNYIHFPSAGKAVQSLFEQVERKQYQKNSFEFSTTFNVKGEERQQLSISLEYAPQKYSTAQIDYVCQFYLSALNSLVDDKSDLLTFNLWLPETKKQGITQAEAVLSDVVKEANIVQLFEVQVLAVPDILALSIEGEQLSFDQLNQRANQLAHYLVSSRGIKPDTLVGLCLERSIKMVVAMLAILKAGGAYVPLDPRYPEARLAYMLEDTDLQTVITTSELLKTLPVTPEQSLCLDNKQLQIQLSKQLRSNVKSDITARDLAYVIYTSGTTGDPKGVMVEHQSVIRLVKDNYYVPLNSNTKMLQASSFAFDAATFEIWGALLNGGQLFLYPDEVMDVTVLDQQINTHKINTLWLTSGLFEQWSQQVSTLASLQYLLVGGDVVSPHAVKKAYDVLSNVSIINGYGPTENTTFTTCYTIPRHADFHDPIPLGQAIRGTGIYVLDDLMNPVPAFVTGQLYTCGAGLARGYLNLPELTAAHFVDNPFSVEQKLYKTGDLVRWLPDGDLAYVGRVDRQVKIRGFRIELEDIEAVLLKHPAVTSCAVLAVDEPKRLVAYVTASVKDNFVKELRIFSMTNLADYMIPSVVVVMDTLPLTANGKIDRKALPAPDTSSQPMLSYLPPTTDTEQTLCCLWQEILQLDNVGITDNFFNLGGDSLSINRLMINIDKTFDCKLAIKLCLNCLA